jgi:thiol-disulfide isomerase/thioredoxin
MRKLLLALILFSITTGPAYAQENLPIVGSGSPKAVTLYLFWGNGCPHCAAEEVFLKTLEKEYPTLTVRKFEVWGSATNREIFKNTGQKLEADIKGVPFTVVGDRYVGGFLTDDTTGAEIRDYVDSCTKDGCTDVVANLAPPLPEKKVVVPKENPWANAPKSLPKEVNVPIIGKISLTSLSLPAIAAVIGALDGFNPCAMWILLFLISLLLSLENRKKRWLLGSTFIAASSLVYFLFMAAWLNILLFIGFIVWVRVAIAVFALGAGAFSLHKYWQHRTGCIVEKDDKRKKTFEKLKRITYDKNLLVALFGIIALAFAVNLVELLCSAGFPAIFTQILSLNQLPPVQYYLYILLYIFFFMLDDIIVFIIAMKTLEVTGISTNYAKYSHLIGGTLMLLIGALLIVKPELLMFSF